LRRFRSKFGQKHLCLQHQIAMPKTLGLVTATIDHDTILQNVQNGGFMQTSDDNRTGTQSVGGADRHGLGRGPVTVTRHNRPVAVVISAAMWDQILADYERLDDAEDLLAVYRSEIKKLRGIDDGRFITDEEADKWLAEDEPIPA
jgi:hypothetical protein